MQSLQSLVQSAEVGYDDLLPRALADINRRRRPSNRTVRSRRAKAEADFHAWLAFAMQRASNAVFNDGERRMRMHAAENQPCWRHYPRNRRSIARGRAMGGHHRVLA